MRDKLKGLLVGLLLGTMVTGSLAYAANSTAINVYFRQMKFVFDGVEKPTDKKPFIYNDTTYVPLRYVAEALGKDVNIDNETGTVWIGKNYGGEAQNVIAMYKGGQITQVELDTQIALNLFYTGQPSQADKQTEIKTLIAAKLLAAKSQASYGAEADKSAADEYERIKQYFGSAEVLAGQLSSRHLTEFDLHQFAARNFLLEKTVESMVSDAAVQAEYDRSRKADSAAFVTADVRHILIATTDNATGKAIRTKEEALARAKEVQDKLAAGGDFAELAKQYSDDSGSKSSGGLYKNAVLTQFVEPFKKASAELELNRVSEPVQTSYGYHLIKVESRQLQTVAEVKDSLVHKLATQTYQNYLSQELPALIESISVPKEP